MSRAILLFAGLWLCGMARGIDLPAAPGTRTSQLSFDVWEVGENLEQDPVTAVVQTRDGYLWLGTYTGLLRFDGVRVTVFDSATTPGFLNGRVTSLYEDRDGVLWIGHAATLDRGELVPFMFDGANGNTFVARVVPARDGGLWVLANGRLKKWREGQWVADLGDCPCERGFVTELLETRSGMLLAGTVKDGLYLLTGPEPVHFSRNNGLAHDWVRSLCEDYEGNIWIGTGGGLDVLRPRKVKMLNPPRSEERRVGKEGRSR